MREVAPWQVKWVMLRHPCEHAVVPGIEGVKSNLRDSSDPCCTDARLVISPSGKLWEVTTIAVCPHSTCPPLTHCAEGLRET